MWSLIWESGFGVLQHLYEENCGSTRQDMQPTPSILLCVCVCVCVFFSEIQTFDFYVAGPGRRLQHGDSADGPHWTCTQCTFQNHPLLDKCETCEMPRLLLGTDTCYCHPAPTKPSPTQPTGNACREAASSWAVVNCGVINRMMWLTEQRCKNTPSPYTLSVTDIVITCIVQITDLTDCWMLNAVDFVWFAPASCCKVNRHPSPSAGSIPEWHATLPAWTTRLSCLLVWRERIVIVFKGFLLA